MQQIETMKSATKNLYNKQLSVITNKIVIKPHIKWEQELDQDINLKILHTIPFLSLKNTNIRAFQYVFEMVSVTYHIFFIIIWFYFYEGTKLYFI